MSLGHYLFSFSGRINRAKQWAFLLVGLVFNFLFFVTISTTIGFETIFHVIRSKSGLMELLQSNQAKIAGLILCALWLLYVYMSLAVRTKRLHDRNKSAWWLLVFLVLPVLLNIPRLMEFGDLMDHFGDVMEAARHGQHYVFQQSPLAIIGGGIGSLIGLWAFVEFYCLRGSVGDNRYGSDPLAGRS